MNWDHPGVRENAATSMAIRQSMMLELRAIRMQEAGEWAQARALLRDAAKELMDRSQQLPAKRMEAQR